MELFPVSQSADSQAALAPTMLDDDLAAMTPSQLAAWMNSTALAPTVRDDAVAVTRLDGPALTVRDDALPSQTLMQLPPTLAARYRIVQPLPTAGGEADLLLVEAVADRQQQYIVKICLLYTSRCV